MQEYEYELNLIENERVKIKYSRKCIISVLFGSLTFIIIINAIILYAYFKTSIIIIVFILIYRDSNGVII
jgi:hypothetical protein